MKKKLGTVAMMLCVAVMLSACGRTAETSAAANTPDNGDVSDASADISADASANIEEDATSPKGTTFAEAGVYNSNRIIFLVFGIHKVDGQWELFTDEYGTYPHVQETWLTPAGAETTYELDMFKVVDNAGGWYMRGSQEMSWEERVQSLFGEGYIFNCYDDFYTFSPENLPSYDEVMSACSPDDQVALFEKGKIGTDEGLRITGTLFKQDEILPSKEDRITIGGKEYFVFPYSSSIAYLMEVTDDLAGF